MKPGLKLRKKGNTMSNRGITITKSELRNLIKESMNAMEQSYISKINTLLSAGDYETYMQGIELIKALSETMPGLTNHPDLLIFSAHDEDGEVFVLNGRTALTKTEAESFTEYYNEDVYIVGTTPGSDGIGTNYEYGYSDDRI